MLTESPQVVSFELIHESSRSRIYKGLTSSGEDVLIKEDLTGDQGRLFNETSISVKSFHSEMNSGMVLHQGKLVMLRNYIPGISLKELIPEDGMKKEEFLPLAILLAKELQNLHQKDILHNDVNPRNFICDIPNQSVKLIDYEFGSAIEKLDLHFEQQPQLIGTMEYISPEQTGRMNRKIDYRSDYYGLGITFYEMLCGRPPFIENDLLRLIHCHLAISPLPPSHFKKSVSKPLDQIILKLLAKNAEDRYQSIAGLISDLSLILDLENSNTSVKHFKIGLQDISSRLRISQKLYGRDSEIQQLESAYDRALKGEKVLLTISGQGGVGKSILCQELYKKVSGNTGFFLSGSFDVMDRQTPYLAFEKAFRQFSDWLLIAPPDAQKTWGERIKKETKGLGRILFDLAPKLEYILTDQPELLLLNGFENQQRLQFAINAFLQSIASSDFPVVLFLDDYQWANEASVELLKSLLSNFTLKNILIIVAYRDQSGNLNNTLMPTLESIRKNEEDINAISLQLALEPLSLENVSQLLSDTLKVSVNELNELSILILSKTKGNPFAIIKLLELLHRQRLLVFEYPENRWTWNLHTIYSLNLSDEVVDILLEKIRTLEIEALNIVKIASVFGLEFSIHQLEMISGQEPAYIHRLLWPLIQEGSLVPVVNDYRFIPEYYSEKGKDIKFRFAHARIQQAVYSLLSKEEKGKRHFEVGKILLDRLSEKELEEKSIELGTHYTLGYSYLTKSEISEKAARILLLAGDKSASSAAFESAFNFTTLGFEILENVLPNDEKFSVLLHLMEYSFLTKNEEKRDKYERMAFDTAKDQTGRILVYENIVKSLTYANQPNSAIVITQKALAESGIKIPDKASIRQIIWEAIKMQFKLPTSKIAGLSLLPRAQDPEKLALFKLISAALPAYYFANIETYPILIFLMLKLTLKHGLGPESLVGIASYGIIRASAMKKPADGYKIVQECRKLVEHEDLKKYAATVKFIHIAFVAHFIENSNNSISVADEGYQNGIAFGNMEYACWSLFFKVVINFHTGKDFKSLHQDTDELIQFLKQYNYSSHEDMMKVVRNSLSVLMADAKSYPDKLEILIQNEEPEFLKAQAEKNNVFLYTYHGFKGITALWFGLNEVAFMNFEKVKEYSKNQPFDVSLQYFELCRGLNAAILFSKSNGNKFKDQDLKKIIGQGITHFKNVKKLNPDIGTPVWEFLTAMLENLEKRTLNETLFEKAISGFEKLNQPRYLVLLLEAYSIQLAKKGNPKSEVYRNQAIKIAGLLHSPGKVQQLIQEDSSFSLHQNFELKSTNQKISGSIETASIDTLTLVKTMDALIGEIKLESLLEKLITYAMENSGAQEGHFLINRQGEWIVEVSTLANHSLHTHFPKAKLETYLEVSSGIVNYAKASKEPVLIEDAILTKPYDSDEIVQRKNLRSILCIPFISQSKISGMIYLTHSETSNAFKQGHISLMRLMAGQIGGIIENALLYENMEKLVEERTRQLEEEKQKSDSLLLNILPKEIAAELMQKGKASARLYDHVSVMFIDIKDFTTIAQAMTPDNLVKNLHEFFTKFDEIMDEFGLEKIKTIGDAYMAAGGIPTVSSDHPTRMVNAALKILDFVKHYNEERLTIEMAPFSIRIGIHSGPVVAGVVGSRKFAYDIWGDTVNIASRMESNGEPGKINISEDHYQTIADQFHCEPRGGISVKNKGVMNMYFVNHPKL